ncbi:hypothetical protein QFZ91_006195 [Paraburkholderia sp. JPY419]
MNVVRCIVRYISYDSLSNYFLSVRSQNALGWTE